MKDIEVLGGKLNRVKSSIRIASGYLVDKVRVSNITLETSVKDYDLEDIIQHRINLSINDVYNNVITELTKKKIEILRDIQDIIDKEM